MSPSNVLTKFNRVLDYWEKSLSQYSETDFLKKPAEDAWSIGQVYIHLIGSANYFHLKQVEKCLVSNEHASDSKTKPGFISFLIGGFLPIKIKVPPTPEYTPPQPVSIADVHDKIEKLRPKMAEVAAILENKSSKSGKTKHHALGYLDAREWFQLIEMHFRHHLRQKGRLDSFLGIKG